MGANLSLGKATNDVPSHGKEVTLAFLQQHWSTNIVSFKVEPVMAETRKGVFKEDGGGASGPSIVRLLLTWADGKFTEEQPETCVLKTEDNMKNPPYPMITRYVFHLCEWIPVELQANECNWYGLNAQIAREYGYSMPKTYCAIRSHHKIKRPSGRQITFRDARQNFRTCVIMEDMNDYSSPPQQSNLSTEKLNAALQNMAKLHAAYWGRTTEFDWIDGSRNRTCTWLKHIIISADSNLPLLGKPKQTFHKTTIVQDVIKDFTTPVGDNLFKTYCDGKNWFADEGVQAALIAFKDKLANDEDARNKILNTPLDHQTINHGDCHAWNHMFLNDDVKESKSSSPYVKAVDFGFVGGGRPTWDLIYFFAMSVKAGDYQADMKALRLYYDALCAAGEKNPNFNPLEYTFEFFLSEFFRLWGTHLIGTCSSSKAVTNSKYLEKQRHKNDGGKGETLTFATVVMYARILERAVDYHKNGVFDKFGPGVKPGDS